MHLHLDDQTAVILGGASGIGLAIAKQFAAENCRVAIIDKSDQTDTQARSVSEGSGRQNVFPLRADVTDYVAMQSAAARITTELGPVHHVIYAAGMGSGKF